MNEKLILCRNYWRLYYKLEMSLHYGAPSLILHSISEDMSNKCMSGMVSMYGDNSITCDDIRLELNRLASDEKYNVNRSDVIKENSISANSESMGFMDFLRKNVFGLLW